MDNQQQERALLWNSLCNMGDMVKLKLKVDGHSLVQQLEKFEDNWCPYNQNKDTHNNRWGLPVTSHTGDVAENWHLNSFGHMQRYHDVKMKEEDFTTPTEVYKAIPQLASLVDIFAPDLGRVHLLRVDAGGFFPPHRDYPGAGPEYFRLLCTFGKAQPENYAHILDKQLIYPDPEYVHFINFQKEHSVFSYTDGLHSLILTVKLNQRTHDLIIKHSMSE